MPAITNARQFASRLIDPVTHLFLHQIARASRAAYTPAMADFLNGLPVDLNEASADEIEAFDVLLDEMEEGPCAV